MRLLSFSPFQLFTLQTLLLPQMTLLKVTLFVAPIALLTTCGAVLTIGGMAMVSTVSANHGPRIGVLDL